MTDFCTVADVANLLQITIAADDASCLRAIKEATAVIKNYTNQFIEEVEDDDITLDFVSGARLFLPELPVTSVTSITENGTLLTADTDYKLGQNGVVYRINRLNWYAGVQVINVVYTHGYSTIPDDIAAICARMASRVYQAGLKSAAVAGITGVVSKSLGDFSVGFGSEQGGGSGSGMSGVSAASVLLYSEKDVLDKYRYVTT